MVDGSTVRHGRVDCSYPQKERAGAEGRVTGTHRSSGGKQEEERRE